MTTYDIPTFPIKRLRYFNNQFLNEQDFIDDQAVHLAHERAHLRALCVAGVSEGLAATYSTTNATLPPTIGPGVAIDSAGQLIVIKDPVNGPAPTTFDDGAYFLHIRFNEVTSDPSGNVGAPGDRRFLAQPLIGGTLKTAALPAGAVVLGTFQIAAHAFTSHSDAGRQFSGVRLPGTLPPNNETPVFATLRSDGVLRGDHSSDGALLGGTLTVRRDVVGGVGGALTVTNGIAAPGNTSAIAALELNACDPGSNAPAVRIQALGDGNHSSHLVILGKTPGAATNALVERMRITDQGVAQFAGPVTAPSITATTSLLTPTAPANVTSADSLFTSSADSELYWRNHASANIKLTANGTLNGGIVGDYGAVGAALAFDDAGDRYTFKQQAPGNWARIASGEVRIFETGTTENVFVGLAAPAALSASYTVTLPTAAPGSTSLVLMDSTGIVSATNSPPNQLSLPAGLTTSSGITLTGTADVQHGSRTLTIPSVGFQKTGPSDAFLDDQVAIPPPSPGGSVATYRWIWRIGTAGELVAPVPLRTGDRITGVTGVFAGNGGGSAGTLTLERDPPSGSSVQVATGSAGPVSISIISVVLSSINYTLVANDALYLRASTTDDNVHLIRATVTWDRP